ncbi:MAG: hypothetical protein ACRDJU_13760 [Actinomycetota bacterium]
MSDDGGDVPDGGHEGGGTGGSWFPEPTALQPPAGADGHGTPGVPGGPRRTSATKILTYAFLFVVVVGVSLYLRSSHDHKNANSGSTSATASPTTGNAGPYLEASWLGQACVDVEPGTGYIVQAAYTSTAGVVSSWEQGLSGGQVTSSAASLAPDTQVGVCYIDGPWKVPATVAQEYAQNGLSPDRGVVVVLQDQPKGQEQVGEPFIVSHKQLNPEKPFVAPPVTSTATSSP